MSDPRIGFGFDAHRLVEGRPLVLGGVTVGSDVGLEGHSDADALLHAVTDAILGACGEPDIGELFSPSDEVWKDAPSSLFLAEALERAAAKGLGVGNVDAVISTERPRLGPWKAVIREHLAGLLGVKQDCVSVKAKTGEGLGPVGEGKLLEARAVVLLCRAY